MVNAITNPGTIYSIASLNQSTKNVDNTIARLSSGLRVRNASDDSASYQKAVDLTSQISGSEVGMQNAANGVSLLQTAQSALASYNGILQDIRDLAVSANNSTMTSTNRSATQAEIDTLLEQLNDIDEFTRFNGIALFQPQTFYFQVGANVGETNEATLMSVATNEVGAATTAGFSSTSNSNNTIGSYGYSTGASGRAIASGDLLINSTVIGASLSSYDSSSYAFQSSSAIAKAAAVNALKSTTNVSASVNANKVEGTSVSANLTASTGFTIFINGTSISTSSAGADLETDLNTIASSINDNQGLTGVSATVVDASGGSYRIDLSASDGRNITLATYATTAAGARTYANASTLGLARSTATLSATSLFSSQNVTYSGSYTLVSETGTNITLDSNTGDIENAGFQNGTYTGTVAGVVGQSLYDSSGSGSSFALSLNDLTINGISVGATNASDDTSSSRGNIGSAIAKAAAINDITAQTSVTATANANVVTGFLSTGDDSTASIVLNGSQISWTASATAATNVSNFVAAVEASKGLTGVSAVTNSSTNGFNLSASDGRNISILNGTAQNGLTNADLYLQNPNSLAQTKITSTTDSTFVGSVSLTSGGTITLDTLSGNIQNAGLNIGAYGGGTSGQLLSEISVLTSAGATLAITAVDNALDQITVNQSLIGSSINGLESSINIVSDYKNVQEVARARLINIDYATEVAALAKFEINQKVSADMVTASSRRDQIVLALLDI